MISRYLASEFIRFFLLIIGAFMVMIVAGNIFGNLSFMFDSWEDFLQFLRTTAMMTPQLLEFTIPITVLLATIATFSTFNRTSELLTIRSLGIGPWGLAWPVLAVTLMISAGNYAAQNYAYPWMHENWADTDASRSLMPIWKVGPDNRLYFFGRRPGKGLLESVTFFQWQSEPFKILERTAIDKGEQQKNSWFFQKAEKHLFSGNHLQFQGVDELRLTQEEVPSVPFQKSVSARNLPLLDLRDEIRKRQSEGLEVVKHRVAIYQKTALPFQLFVMVFVGIALSSSHSRKGMAAESLALSCLLAILFWIMNQILLALGEAGNISPVPAAWGSITFFAGIAWLLHRIYRI